MQFARKTTPRVRDGRAQRKNHRDVASPRDGVRLRVHPPRPGYHHTVTEPELRRFIALLPDWDDLSVGLAEIVLTDGHDDLDGWYEPGSVHVCAWPDGPVVELTQPYYEDHREVLQQLGVRAGKPGWRYCGLYEPDGVLDLDANELIDDQQGRHLYQRVVPCRFSRGQARAFQLLHVLLHELGHHRDSQRAPARGECVRGEEYAESYALRHGSALLARYRATFGL